MGPSVSGSHILMASVLEQRGPWPLQLSPRGSWCLLEGQRAAGSCRGQGAGGICELAGAGRQRGFWGLLCATPSPTCPPGCWPGSPGAGPFPGAPQTWAADGWSTPFTGEGLRPRGGRRLPGGGIAGDLMQPEMNLCSMAMVKAVLAAGRNLRVFSASWSVDAWLAGCQVWAPAL